VQQGTTNLKTLENKKAIGVTDGRALCMIVLHVQQTNNEGMAFANHEYNHTII
jgi:hypothetical protein